MVCEKIQTCTWKLSLKINKRQNMSFPIFIRCFIMVTPFQADVCRERFSCLSQHYSVFSLRITLQNLSVEISNIFFEIGIDGTNLNAVEHFTYLGSVITKDATVSKDLDNRLSKASSSVGRLSKRVWQSHSLRLSTKLLEYRAVVVTTVLYGAET